MKAIEQYFNYLKDAGADVPSTAESFKKTLSDKTSAEQYYGYLKQNNFDAPESFDSFAKTLGLNKPATVPVKKKDGSDPLSLDTPSVSGLNPEDPTPSVSALLKQRKKLKAEKSAPKPTSAPGFALATVETAPVIDYDAQISKIDEQIKAKGFDPDELDVKFGEYDIDLDDNKLKELYTNYRSKPFATTRQLNATTWHQAIERVQSKNPNEQIKQKNLGELKKLITDGYKLPSYDLNTAINFGRNAYQQILTLTADGDGKDREIAIENFKKDYSPVLAQIALRDKNFSSQPNLPLQMGLLFEDIFEKSKADNTRAMLTQDLSGNPDAVKGRDRIRYGVEENGLALIQAGAGEEIESKYDQIKTWLDWQKNNLGRLSDLSQKINAANPEVKSVIDAANAEILKINKSLENSPLEIEVKKQKEIVDQYENDYKAGIIGRDIYAVEVDKYNELAEQYNNERSQAKYKADQIAGVANEKAASSGVSPEELKEYNRLRGEFDVLENERALAERANIWSNYFTKEKNKIVKNNPTVVADRIIMQMQEWDGENANTLERFFLNLGSIVPKAADAFEIIYDSFATSPEKKIEKDLERAGRSGTDDLLLFYEANKNKLFESPIIFVVPESIEKRRREIDANPNLNDAERVEAKKRIARDGILSGEIYQTTNPNAGKINITAKSILNSAATVVPQILVAAGISSITGGVGTGVAISTFLNGYSSYYNDAVSQRIANPNQYAFAHSLVDYATEMIGTSDLRLIQNALKGTKGVGAKFFKDLTDGEFKALLAGSKNAFKNTGKAFVKNTLINAGESVEESGAALGGNIIDQELFGIKKQATEGVAEAFITTNLGQLPLTLLGVPVSVSRTNIANKYALYNAATDLNGTMAFLKSELDAGNLTSQEYTDRVKLVNDYAKAINQTPATYADGNPMRDDDKAKYAFNQFISNMKADKSPLPPQQKQAVDQVIADVENENDKILSNATNQSQVQEGRTEGDLGQPQGIVQGQPEVGQGAGSQGQAEVTTANVGDSNISGQGQVAPPGKRLFNEPNPEAAVIETEFKKSKGIDTPEPAPITKLDEEKSKKIADAYDQLVDSPNDPVVQQAYQAMADETMQQFDAIDKAGVKVEIWTGKGEPYKNSAEMIADVRDNKHMYIFSTEEGFGDTPITEEQRQQNALLRDSGVKDINGKPLLINDIFRFVHDYFGHTRLGNSFGAIGEENAWNVHARMYSPLARRAMTTETRGQNSWVNFNKNFRNPDGSMKKKGDEGYVPPAQRPFADQKMALLPEEFSNIEDSYSLKSETPIDKALNQAVPKATQALEQSGIKFQVVDATTDTEEARAARGNQGLFRSEDGTIIIDKSKLADEIEAGIVVWHEASHPVMNIIRNTDKPLYDAVVRGLKQAAKKNKGVAGALNWAQSQEQYDNEDTQNDEAVVETIGRINAGLIDINSLDTGLRQKLIDFINSIAKYFGIDPILNDRDIAAFKKTVSEVADALKTGRNIGEIVGQENVGDFQNNRTQTRAVTIAKGTESMRKYGLKEGKNTTRKIGEALEKRTREKLGIIGREDRSESAMKKISSYMADEVRYFIEQFGENSGKGWYGEKFQKGIDAMSKIFPEFETDQNARDLFTMLVAVTSDGTEVMQNFKQASMAYQNFKDTGKMPTEASAQRSASYLVNFKNIQDLLDKYNGDIAAIKKELLKVSSISDLNKERKGQGLEKLKTSWPAGFKVPLAASIFGPKLGMFYANLSGMENYPTLDRWWSRTFNRYRGTLIPQITRGFNKKGEALGIDRYKQIAGLENASEDEIIAKIIQDHDTYEDKGFKKGTDAEKAANTLYKKLFIELNDAPFGAKDREFMYDTFVDAKKKLKTSGINVTIADIQAILWYFEKNLYKKLGVTKPIQGISYEDAALKTFDKWSKAGGSFDYNIEKAEEGDTIEEIDEMSEDVADQASVGNRDMDGMINWEKLKPGKGDPKISSRNPIVTKAAADLKAGKITNEEYRAVASENSPIRPITKFFEPATKSEVRNALSTDKLDKIDTPIQDGSSVGIRLDIPAFKNNNTWVVSVHEGNTNAGKSISYTNVARITDVNFGLEPKAGLKIAAGESKSTIGRIFGKWQNLDGANMEDKGETAKEIIQDAVGNPDWVQVGFNPFRHSYFYDRSSDMGRPIVSADEVVQIGGLVYAKNPIYGNWTDESYRVKGLFDAAGAPVQFSVGNRSEEDLRAEGTGKERPRALASRYGNLNPATQAKIEDDATVYFQRTNKQTKEAVDKFLDGLNIMDAADYVLSNPKIPEVSQVWMAAEVAKRLNAEIDAAGNNQDLIDDLTRKQADIFNEFAKKATSLGQAVQAFIAFKDNANAVEFFLPKILRRLKKDGVENVTEEQRAEILTLLKDVNTAAEGLPKDKAIIKLSHYLAGIAPMKPMDVLQSIWYAKILSGITTQSTNFFANIFNTVFELPVVALRISMLNGTPLGMLAGAKGFASGVAKGAVTAADIIKSGVRSKEVDKYFAENPLEYFTWSKWLGNKGKVLDYIPPLNFGAWKYVGRILAATDAFFATANQEAIANMLAYAEAAGTPAGNNFKKANEILGNNKMSVLRARAQAKAEGFEPGTIQYKRRELEIIAQKRTGTQEADEIGKRITMNYDPEGFTKPLFDAVVGLQKNIPAIKMVIPFARIVANLTENGLNYSPFGFAKAVTGIKNPFQGLKSERMNFDQRTDMFYKSMIGISSLLAIVTHVGEDEDDWFEITAGGSPDIQKKYELQKGGWRPYTITFKDGTKISYKDWPIAGVLAGLGHVRDAKKYSFDDSTLTGLYAYGFFLNMYDKSLLSGLQDFFGIFNVNAGRGKYAPDTKASERAIKYAAQQVKSVALSNLSQQSFKLYSELVTGDPQRDAKTFAQIIYRDIPSLNDGIRPIIDVFGDEVPYTTTERLLPVMDSPEKEEIIEWLNKNKMFVGVPMRKNIKLLDGTERPMTDDEYYEYRKNAGKSVKKFINEFMSEIKNQDIGKEAFEKVVDAARQEAYGEILMKANNL